MKYISSDDALKQWLKFEEKGLYKRYAKSIRRVIFLDRDKLIGMKPSEIQQKYQCEFYNVEQPSGLNSYATVKYEIDRIRRAFNYKAAKVEDYASADMFELIDRVSDDFHIDCSQQACYVTQPSFYVIKVGDKIVFTNKVPFLFNSEV